MFSNVSDSMGASEAATIPWRFKSETIYELSAHLLFMNIRWAKNLPTFMAFPFQDQNFLLEESWCQLFVLGVSQFALPIEADTLNVIRDFGQSNLSFGTTGMLSTRQHPCQTAVSSEDQLGLPSEIKTFQETVAKFRLMNVDPTEYACLFAVILFKPCKSLIRFAIKVLQ